VNLTAAVGIASAAASALLTWQLSSGHFRSQALQREVDLQRSTLSALERQAAETQRMQEKKDEALRLAAVRQSALASDVAAGRDALERLSHTAARAIQGAKDSHSACLEKVDAFADVFGQCRVRLREVGEAADDHASDAKTLIDAWSN
jgi:hypothetical protein